MTVDLSTMMDLRDVQVALDVAKRAELGWFDVEFTMYGCAYLKDGQRFYTISSEAEKIYDCIAANYSKEIFSSLICSFSEKYPVPTGMQEYIALDIKKELAKDMSNKYPKEFFLYLNKLAKEVTQNTAKEFLDEILFETESCFDEKRISFFENMVDFFYEARKINETYYKKYTNWIREERKNMEENIICKDIFEKTFYGIAYLEQDNVKYFVNARKDTVYQKKYELETQNIFSSFILSETYYYNYDLKIPQVKKSFEELIRKMFDRKLMEKLNEIISANSSISKEDYKKILVYTKEHFGSEAEKTVKHYGSKWGILK